MALILTVDVGTSNIKAGVLNAKGEILSVAGKQNQIRRPRNGAYEHDPKQLRDDIIALCREVGAPYKTDIRLLTISTYQFGLLLLDDKLRPITGISTLLDIRAQETFDQFRREIPGYDLYKRTGCPPFFQYPLARLYYLRKKEKEIFKQASYFLSSKDFLIHEFTGELLAEPSLASATQMMNVSKLDWDDEALAIAQIERSKLPPVEKDTLRLIPIKPEILSEMGLSSDVQLIPGVYDGGALGIGISGLEPNVATLNLGTSGMLRVPSSEPTFDQTPQMRFQTYYLAGGNYFIGGAINNGTIPLKWLKENILGHDYPDMAERAAKVPLGSRGLFVLPYLSGERDWQIGDVLSGSILGLREFHTKDDIMRGVLEGVGFSLCLIRNALLENQITIDKILMGGGGTKIDLWVQICADILHFPISVTKSAEPSLIGSAMLGFQALKLFPDLRAAAKAMTPETRTFDPIPDNADRYSKLFESYRTFYREIGDLLAKNARFAETLD